MGKREKVSLSPQGVYGEWGEVSRGGGKGGK